MSTQWIIKHCDILDEPADVLVFSANPNLSLSGGVGGAFLLKYGDEMQQRLSNYLAENGLRCVQRGDVVRMPSCGSPYRAVLHAVGVDAFYGTSIKVVTSVISQSLEMAASLSAKKVALAAIATGYGRMSLSDFAEAFVAVTQTSFPPINEVALCLRKRDEVEELQQLCRDQKTCLPESLL